MSRSHRRNDQSNQSSIVRHKPLITLCCSKLNDRMQQPGAFSNHTFIRKLAIGYILLCQQHTSALTLRPPISARLNIQGVGSPPRVSCPTRNTNMWTNGCRHFASDLPMTSNFESADGDVNRRPPWARNWMPTWLFNLRPSVQIFALVLTYIFHITVLCQTSIHFPVQLIPNERGYFQSIGLDS